MFLHTVFFFEPLDTFSTEGDLLAKQSHSLVHCATSLFAVISELGDVTPKFAVQGCVEVTSCVVLRYPVLVASSVFVNGSFLRKKHPYLLRISGARTTNHWPFRRTSFFSVKLFPRTSTVTVPDFTPSRF